MAKAKTKPRRPDYRQIDIYWMEEGEIPVLREKGCRPQKGYIACRLKDGRTWDVVNGYTKPKNKGGRPSKKDTIDRDQVKALAQRGWTDEEMAGFFGVAASTWNKWKAEDKAFSEPLKDWKVEADARVERSLYERATGYSHDEQKIMQYEGEPVIVDTVKHYPPDPTSMIFWLKNRQSADWRDKREIDQRLSIDDMTEEEVDAQLAELEAAEAGSSST